MAGHVCAVAGAVLGFLHSRLPHFCFETRADSCESLLKMTTIAFGQPFPFPAAAALQQCQHFSFRTFLA